MSQTEVRTTASPSVGFASGSSVSKQLVSSAEQQARQIMAKIQSTQPQHASPSPSSTPTPTPTFGSASNHVSVVLGTRPVQATAAGPAHPTPPLGPTPSPLPQSSTTPAQDKLDQQNQKKRKRVYSAEEEEEWRRAIRRKLDDERRVLDETANPDYANKELYMLYNELQGLSNDFQIEFQHPELVVVGMQSDGKSSFIEGLLGFQFNIVDTNIGTRRPLIIQMINNPAKDVPSCRFRKERLVAADEDTYEERETPVSALSDEIIARTEEKAGKAKDKVSDSPIFLRVEYKSCANLTIYDLPGFRLTGNDQLRKDIEDMAMKIMAPKHRIIVCLEQSTTEWANTVSRVDPDFSRTILVNTKFDNRVKELRDAESADVYLAGEGITVGKKVFFISMPLRRNLDQTRFAQEMKETYISDLRNLLEVHFDEQKHSAQVGFFRLKSYLEKHLKQAYLQSLAPTMQILDSLTATSEAELGSLYRELQQADINVHKAKVSTYLQTFGSIIERLLVGTVIGDPEKVGQTLREEKVQSGVGDWPNVSIQVDVMNQDLKIYGGSQFERLMREFEHVGHSIEFPAVTMHEVAAAIGTSKGHNAPSYESAISDLVQVKSRKLLLPLLQTVLRRCLYVIRRTFDIAVSVVARDFASETFALLGQYDTFVSELRGVFNFFLDEVARDCEGQLTNDFAALTKCANWELLAGLKETAEYDYTKSSPEDTKRRCDAIMSAEPPVSFDTGSRSRVMTNDLSDKIKASAGRMFSGVRLFFVKFARVKFNSCFMDPIFQKLSATIRDHFGRLTDEKYEELFNSGIAIMRERAQLLEIQVAKVRSNRDKCRSLMRKVETASL